MSVYNDMSISENKNQTRRYRVWLLASAIAIAGLCFICFHTPYADTGFLAGRIKSGMADWSRFMWDPDYPNYHSFFGKPVYLFYTVLFKYLVPLRYAFVPACMFVMIILNGYLAKRIFSFFFCSKTTWFATFFYAYLLYVAYWLCALRPEIYQITIMHVVLLNSLHFLENRRIGFFYANIVLACSLALTIHPNSFYILLFVFVFFIVFKIYRTHLWPCVFLAVFCTIVGLGIVLYPSLAGFQANMKYLATRDGHRFLIVLKFFQILSLGFYKNGYQYPFVVSIFALTILNFKRLMSFVRRPSPNEKIFLVYVVALCAHFLFVPSANWKMYSIHFLFPLAYLMVYLLDGRGQTKLNIPLSIAVCVLLIFPVIREYQFGDKAGVIIPCTLFLVFLAVSRFKISRRLVVAAMSVFVCINVFQLYVNHRWYRQMSAVLIETGATTIVTDSIFEFLGEDYDIRPMGRNNNIAKLGDCTVMLLDKDQLKRSGLTRQPDRHFRFNNHFIPRVYQEWFLFLPVRDP